MIADEELHRLRATLSTGVAEDREAIRQLAEAAQAGSATAWTLLLSGLDDVDPEIRCETASALVFVRTGNVAAALLQHLDDDSDVVRWHIVEALRMRGERAPGVLAAVRDALHDPSPGVRYQAVGALMALERPAEAARTLAQLCDPDANVQAHIDQALRLLRAGGSA